MNVLMFVLGFMLGGGVVFFAMCVFNITRRDDEEN